MRVQLWTPGAIGFGGGIGYFSLALADGLVAVGHVVRLGGLVDGCGQRQGMRVFGAGAYPAWARRPVFALQCLREAALHRPTEIICTHVNLGPLALAASRLSTATTVLIAHGVDVRADLPAARLAALRRADRLLAVSAWSRGRLERYCGIDGDRVQILPNTFDGERFRVGPRPLALARRLGISEGERVILTVARLDPREAYKGYDRVLEALPEVIATCGPVRFVVVGRGEDGQRLRVLAQRLGLESCLVLTGFVPDDELPAYYRLADVFAMPSTGEGFGIVLLEAMACGTPVLAGNRDGSVDAVAGGCLGALVDPLAVDAIAAGLVRLLRREGPALWFDPERLSQETTRRFGRRAFEARLRDLFG